jgi:DNA-binding MarR family transcriptional regulator
MDAGLIKAEPNPDHKRAVLLRATEQGVVLKREIDARADAIADEVAGNIDADLVQRAAALLRDIRKELEQRLRTGEKK